VEEEVLDLPVVRGGIDRRPANWTTGGSLLGRSRPAFASAWHSRLCGALPLARSRSRVAPAPVTHAPAT